MSESLTLQLSKTIRTTRARAFAAWTQPAELMQWFAPGPMHPESIEVELRVGGVFRWVMSGPSPANGQHVRVVFAGEFLEIEPGRRLQFTWQSESNPADSTRVTVSFADVEGGTEVLLFQERISTEEIYNRNKSGWGSMLEKLAALCADATVTVG